MQYKTIGSKYQVSQEDTNGYNQLIYLGQPFVEDSNHHYKWKDVHLFLAQTTLLCPISILASSSPLSLHPQPSFEQGTLPGTSSPPWVPFPHNNSSLMSSLMLSLSLCSIQMDQYIHKHEQHFSYDQVRISKALTREILKRKPKPNSKYLVL